MSTISSVSSVQANLPKVNSGTETGEGTGRPGGNPDETDSGTSQNTVQTDPDKGNTINIVA